MSDQTSIVIDFNADELTDIAKAMKRMNLTFSEFIDLAIKKAVNNE